MAPASSRQLPAAPPAFTNRQLDDGQALGARHPRFRDDVQGVSPGYHQEHSPLRGNAPLHSCAGSVERSEGCRGADSKHSATGWKVALWNFAHLAGAVRPSYDPILDALHDAASALFWPAWS